MVIEENTQENVEYANFFAARQRQCRCTPPTPPPPTPAPQPPQFRNPGCAAALWKRIIMNLEYTKWDNETHTHTHELCTATFAGICALLCTGICHWNDGRWGAYACHGWIRVRCLILKSPSLPSSSSFSPPPPRPPLPPLLCGYMTLVT